MASSTGSSSTSGYSRLVPTARAPGTTQRRAPAYEHSLTQLRATAPARLQIKLYTKDVLAGFDGTRRGRMYLSILGEVYDVSAGTQYYGEDNLHLPSACALCPLCASVRVCVRACCVCLCVRAHVCVCVCVCMGVRAHVCTVVRRLSCAQRQLHRRRAEGKSLVPGVGGTVCLFLGLSVCVCGYLCVCR